MLLDAGREQEVAALVRRFDQILDRHGSVGLDGPVEIRSGDKASELLKHLALSAEVCTVVWGSNESALKDQAAGKAKHWLSKVKSEFQCPVVTSRARRP
jgi:hypothetical protein